MTRVPQSNTLLELANKAHLFKTPEGEAYAALPDGATYPVRSQSVRDWLTYTYFQQNSGSPNRQALDDTLNTLAAQARFQGKTEEVFVRLGWHDSSLFLDLGDKVVEARGDGPGWRIRNDAPIRFIRPRGLLPLPEPVGHASIEELRPFINVASEQDWVLIVSWLLGALNPTGPYPLLALHGEKGSGKSSATRFLRALIDPAIADAQRPPRDAESLTLKARHNWVVAVDNVSSMPAWLSDDLCRLATGHADSSRQKYTDTDEVLFKAKRPVILNGIPEFARAGDLLDRLIPITLPTITKRQDETKLNEQFEAARPHILGALLDAAAAALAGRDSVSREDLPRMADFAIWMRAAEQSLGWAAGTFDAAYTQKQSVAAELELEASPIASAVRDFATKRGHWTGTATALLLALEDDRGYGPQPLGWPKNARALSDRLWKDAGALREVGISVTRGRSGSRTISLDAREVA